MPRLVHWIWFNEARPAWVTANVQTFQRLHPEWEFRVWHELPDEFPDDLRELIDRLPWYSSRSDIFRYWLLAEFGGVYLDTDNLALRSFEPLLDCEFFLGTALPEGHTQSQLACGLMGSVPGSVPALRILQACREVAAEIAEPRRTTFGPDLLTPLFADEPQDVTALPKHYFYAIPDRETAHRFWHADKAERAAIMKEFEPEFTDDEEPYAVHLWGVDGSSQRKVPESIAAS